jgi:hypothetical protein
MSHIAAEFRVVHWAGREIRSVSGEDTVVAVRVEQEVTGAAQIGDAAPTAKAAQAGKPAPGAVRA